jgi:hypothetical protein
VLGIIVCAPNVYAPVCISDITLVIFAFAIASGRKPSKLTINTCSNLGAGVDVIVGRGVSVGGGGVLLGVRVAEAVGTIVGGRGVAVNPHDSRKIPRRVKSKMRRIIFKMISPASAFSTRDVWRRQSQFDNPRQRDAPRPCLDLSSGLFPI